MKRAVNRVWLAVRAENDPTAEAMTLEESIRDEVGEKIYYYMRAGQGAYNNSFGRLSNIGVPIPRRIKDQCGKDY